MSLLVQSNNYIGGVKSFNVNLFLPDAVHDVIVKRAKEEGVDPAHFCSSLIMEALGPTVLPPKIGLPFTKRDQSANGISVARSNLSDTLEQIFAVCRCVWQDKMEFTDAVHKVAMNFKVNETTIRDKCTRRISLQPHSLIDTEKFLDMLGKPTALRDYLCHRFPKYSTEIVQRFDQISA